MYVKLSREAFRSRNKTISLFDIMPIGLFPLKFSLGSVADLFDFTSCDPDCSAINRMT